MSEIDEFEDLGFEIKEGYRESKQNKPEKVNFEEDKEDAQEVEMPQVDDNV
jgi:hypothetical protein